jgi:Flp pilus assembly protein TadG
MPIHRRAGRDRESGTTAIEFIVWTPLLMFMIVLAVQLAMYLFAEHVASTAAQAGARAAREDEATDSGWQKAAVDAANSWINNLIEPAGTTSVSARIAAPAPNACTPAQVEVTVTFQVDTMFGKLTVNAMNEGPVENYYPDDC